MREAILWVGNFGFLWSISGIIFCLLISGTTSLSDCTQTFGRQSVLRITWWTRGNTPSDGILRLRKRLPYSSTAGRAFPSQNPYTNACHSVRCGKKQKALLLHFLFNSNSDIYRVWSRSTNSMDGIPTQKRACAVYEYDVTLNGYSKCNRKKTTYFFRL